MRLIGYTQAGHAPNSSLADQPGPLPKFAGFQPLSSQPTNGSFMQSQPSSIVPQNTTTFQSQPQDPIPPLNANDYAKFASLFIKTTGSATTDLDGVQARDIFLKAKLPTDTLGQIWNLVDTDNIGKLPMPNFIVAMHLLQGVLSGTIKQLPPFLPDSIWQSVGSSSQGVAPSIQTVASSSQPAPQVNIPNQPGSRQSSYASVSSQQTVRHTPTYTKNDEWKVTPVLKQQYDAIFDNLDKSKSGQLNPDQVAQFLMTSKLNQADLASVWDLSDIQNTGIFTKIEFAIALFLVNKKLAGGALPNIVPDTLLKSVTDLSKSAPAQVAQLTVQQPQNTASKSSMDELVDVFASPSPAPQQTKSVQQPPQYSSPPPVTHSIQSRTSSSDLAHDLPKVRKNLTGFQPTSTFGQSLMKNATGSPVPEHTDLLGEDVSSTSTPDIQPQSPVKETAPSTEAPKAVNYDALRSVPPPPQKRQSQIPNQPAVSAPPPQSPLHQQTFSHQPPAQQPAAQQPPAQQPPAQSERGFSQPGNNDLLADPTTSAQFSQATSDIANISNQVKSLSGQTTDLHDNKGRAEQELAKILTTKKEIEAKLRILRSSYDNEVKQFQEVETSLTKAKEETEALRSESSITEAKFNHLSGELNDKQLAMENLQKENGAVKERLGAINAEIGELQKQIESVTAENQRLSNQLSVQKSQVQVSIVRKEELQNKYQEIEAENKRIQEQINQQHQEQQKHEQDHQKLAKDIETVKSFKPEIPKVSVPKVSIPEPSVSAISSKELNEPEPSSKGVAQGLEQKAEHGGLSKGVLGAVVGAVTGGAAIAGAAASGISVPGAFHQDSKAVPEPEFKGSETEFKESETKQPESVPESVSKEINQPPIEALVDEVKEKPSADMTGIEADIEPVPSTPKPKDDMTTTSSVLTGDGETPVTSPSNSDFQFPQGGMVGMPGVLVGVQRTDSLTSSVQNNASMSVRDDNIEEVSDRDTIGNEETEQAKSKSENGDSDKISSGVESFEIVNAEDARHPEDSRQEEVGTGFTEETRKGYATEPTGFPSQPTGTQYTEETSSGLPSGENTFSKEVNHQTTNGTDEFPPIKELDYDESDSSDDEAFHEAQDLTTKPKADDFDSAFDDLEPAAPEKAFDEFDGLEEAQVDDTNLDEFGNDASEDFFNNDFTNSNMPDFNQEYNQEPEPKNGNDEWEQLFAGFGNSASAQNTPVVDSKAAFPAVHPHQSLIDELEGMGFDNNTATEALERENWNLEAATNYLLDHA